MDSITIDVNSEQREAITFGEGPLLVVAGAGSGKTRVITRRIAHLVQQGVPPWQIVALTFTNKAAREMRGRVEELVAARDLWVCTFHSFAARVLRRYADHVGHTGDFSIYDTEDKTQVIKAILKEKRMDGIRPAEVAHALTRVKNGMDRPETSEWDAERISAVMRSYETRLRAANAMDFDDLLVNLLRVLAESGEAQDRLRRRAKWLLVDEYQDTNEIQGRILSRLVPPDFNICATGDPDQSIYRWRGATIHNILGFESEFPGARLITLDRNYRSTKAILDVANAVIRHNRDRYEKDLYTVGAAGPPVREVRCLDDVDEARMAAREMAGWLSRGRSARDIALFYRVNAQSRLLERALHEAGIPYAIVGAVAFYKRKEVKDLLAYLRVARNPRDRRAFLRIFNVPARGLGKTTEERLLKAAAARSLPPRELLRDRDGLSEFARARKPLARLADLLDAVERLPMREPKRSLERLIELTQYRAYLGDEVERILNVEELVNAAAEYERREPGGGIDGFLAENALVSDQDAYDEGSELATLMTVHAAKGLEFPCVVVAGLEEQLFPHALSLDEPEEVEEERRLFYVAATRAKEELVFLHGQARLHQGRPMPSVPSRFLDEIPDALLEVEDRTADPFSPDVAEERVCDVNEDIGGDLRAGDRVRHSHFGAGRVHSVRTTGGGTRVTVDFDRAGRRELSLVYARLERI